MSDRILSIFDQDVPIREVFNHAPIMMIAFDAQGQLLQVSDYWADAMGYDRDEMIGRGTFDFLSPVSRAHAEQAVLPRLLETGRINDVELDFLRKDGSSLPVLLSAMAVAAPGGEFRHALAFMFDNTESQRVKAELSRNHRMEAVGSLVGSVAHDFNNLLSVIQGNLEFLKDDFDGPMRSVHLHDAMGAVQRGGLLTQQLLTFERKAQTSPKALDLNSVIREADGMLRRLMPANVEFETVATGGLWKTMVDQTQLDTAVLNIVNNACDAMPEGGRITVETSNISISEDFVDNHPNALKPGRYVMLAISDTGAGMSREDADRAFEPFFTTKAIGKGSGLGLSMVLGFVRQSGGTVQIHSELGFGTTVKMYFPAIEGQPSQAADEKGDPILDSLEPPSVLADILVVEDEANVRRIMVRQLTSRGLKVAEASSGDLARDLLRTGYKPRVMITDVVMPGQLQGPELARIARDIVPDIRVIFVSGDPNQAASHGDGLRVSDMQLVKPVAREVLLKAVLTMLEGDD